MSRNQVKVEFTKSSRVSGMGRFTFLALVCLGLWMPGRTARAQVEFVPSLDDATLEKYQGLQLVSRVHIAHVYLDHEKWGFFKIGLIPIQVVEGVNIQIFSAGSLTNALDAINPSRLSSTAQRHLELRKLQISLLGEKEPRLQAASASIAGDGVLQLSHVSVSNAGEAISISKATLQVSGADCGCLRWINFGKPEQLFVFHL